MNVAPVDQTVQSGRSVDAEHSVMDPADRARRVWALVRGRRLSPSFAPLAALLFSTALLLMGNGLLVVLLPVRAAAENFATLEVGVLGAAYFLGFAIGCLAGPRVIRRVGHVRTFAAMVSLASAMVLAHAMVLAPVAWWLGRAVTGLCLAVLFMVIESWLNERSTNENRGRIFSIYTIVNLTVVTVGQMMLTLEDPREFALFASASILVSLAAIPVALTRAEAPAPLETVRLRVFHLYRSSPVGFAGAVAVGLTNGAFWSLAPVFVHENRFAGDPDMVAIFMSVAVMAGAIGQWPLGRVSDRMDRRRVVLVASIGAAAVGLATGLFSDRWAEGLFVFPFLFGMFVFPLYTLCAAHVNDSVKSGEFVEAAGVLLLLVAAGAVGGSLVASGAMHLYGPSALFYCTAAVHAMLVVFTLARIRARPPRAVAEREPFADSIRVAHTVSLIDPIAVETVDGPGDATHAGGEAAGEKVDETVLGCPREPASRPVSGTTD